MKPSPLDQLIEAVLYEGHILYPYRPSSQKNRHRFTFGRVYPESYSTSQQGAESCVSQTQCLVRTSSPGAQVRVEVRFLHPLVREIGVLHKPQRKWVDGEAEPAWYLVPRLELNGILYQTWQESAERRVELNCAVGVGAMREIPFEFPATRMCDPIRDHGGRIPAAVIRRNETVRGSVILGVEALQGDLFRLTVRVANLTDVPADQLGNQDSILLRTLASTHTILRGEGAEFISVTAPPDQLAVEIAECQNLGTWPVLVGDEASGQCDTMLSSPIILPDYPKLAPESAGTLYDGTEIDEILTLRILAMTDGEKREMRHLDEDARRLLERTEALPNERLLGMHGTLRNPGSFEEQIFGGSTKLQTVEAHGVTLRAGDTVRIRPKARADVMDLALAGKVAIIEAIEQDAEGRAHLALVVEDDPGRDLGFLRQTGHRFFYTVDEVEPTAREATS
ncbi:MAG: hypothetical protein JWM35_1439 [Verrucomicrobia bacterium]|nr:hypothetical protein [Verrucomicrobiota bacterium]